MSLLNSPFGYSNKFTLSILSKEQLYDLAFEIAEKARQYGKENLDFAIDFIDSLINSKRATCFDKAWALLITKRLLG